METEYKFTDKVTVTHGDPVRIDGHRGLWRFLSVENDIVNVVGPYTNRTRSGPMPLTRSFLLTSLRPAPKGALRNDVNWAMRQILDGG